MYNKKVLDHFTNPRNVGEIKDASGVGEVGNAACGDIMKVYLKVNEEGIIEDIKFQTFGCASAIASSSIATEMVKGKHIEEARKLTNKAIAEALDGLPTHKIHCSVLAADAINRAIDDYLGIQKETEIVCKCLGIEREEIEEAVAHGAKTLDEVKKKTGAGSGACGGKVCGPVIKEIIKKYHGELAPEDRDEEAKN